MSEHWYTDNMNKSSESVTLDEDVQRELKKFADRMGQSVDAVANAVLRAYARAENDFVESVARGIADAEAGRVHTTAEVRAILEEQRRLRAR
jgi:predicted transcriptional regulator